MEGQTWVRTVIEDPDHPGELMLDLSDVCQAMGWQVGDRLEWIDNQDGTWTLQKANTQD